MADGKTNALTGGREEVKLIDLGDGTNAFAVATTTGTSINVVVTSMPAASSSTDTIGAARLMDRIMDGLTPLTPKRFFANIAASQTDANLITAVASKKLHIVQLQERSGATATNITFNSKGAGAGTAISSLHANGANGGAAPGANEYGFYETNSGEAFTCTTGAGSSTGVEGVYCER